MPEAWRLLLNNSIRKPEFQFCVLLEKLIVLWTLSSLLLCECSTFICLRTLDTFISFIFDLRTCHNKLGVVRDDRSSLSKAVYSRRDTVWFHKGTVMNCLRIVSENLRLSQRREKLMQTEFFLKNFVCLKSGQNPQGCDSYVTASEFDVQTLYLRGNSDALRAVTNRSNFNRRIY